MCAKHISSKNLRQACQENDEDLVKALLKNKDIKKNIDEKVPISVGATSIAKTALHVACENARYNIVSILLQNGAKVNIPDKDGDYPIHDACGSKIDPLSKTKALLEKNNKHINTKGFLTLTPLHRAVEEGNNDVVKYLLENGASVKVTNTAGWTPVHCGTLHNEPSTMKILLAHDASGINHQTANGFTPLHIAAYRGKFETVRALADHPDCDRSITATGRTALELAKRFNTDEVVEYLIKKDKKDKQKVSFSTSSSECSDGKVDGMNLLETEMIESMRETSLTQKEYASKSRAKSKLPVKSKTPHGSKSTKAGLKTPPKGAKSKPPLFREPSRLLSDVTLDRIADRIGEQQVSLGLRLGFSHDQIRRARQEWISHKDTTLYLLVTWRNDNAKLSDDERIDELKEIFAELRKQDIVKFLEDLQN